MSSSHPSLSEILSLLKDWLQENYADNLCQVVLYGSQARGDAKPTSDIDVLVVLKQFTSYYAEIDKTSHFIADLSLDYDTVVSRAFVTEAKFNNENSPFLMNVRRERKVGDHRKESLCPTTESISVRGKMMDSRLHNFNV